MSARAPHPSPSREAGSVLVEAMVSAVVMLVAIAALFVVLDVQTDASADTRASSTAATLAEQDQERLRSFSVGQLAGKNETRTVPVAGVNYTVVSTAEWISDATGATESCSSTGQEAQYLRLTSIVTPPTGGTTPVAPVRLRSLMASPAGLGTVTVKVTGGAGQAIQGISATITGAITRTATTNSLGCAVFTSVPVGPYTATASASGFVDEGGNTVATGSATSAAGTANIVTLTYDRAARVNATFDTEVSSVVSSTASFLSAANSGLPSSTCGERTGSAVRLFCSTSGPQAALSATLLFPFSTAYTLYSGSCDAANPAKYVGTYFNTAGRGSIVAAPGSVTAVTLREPALRLTLRTGPANRDVHVRATAIEPGCTDTFDWNVNTGSSKSVLLPDPGLPFGRYRVCADTVVGSTTQRETIMSVDLISRTGSAPQEIDLSSTAVPAGTTAATGPCT